MRPRHVALVSDDMLFRSQLEAALRHGGGGELRPVRRGDLPDPDADAVFVDLNADSGHRLGLIATLRERQPSATIVAFCHHGDKELRTMAMRVGASSCITNGALQAVAVRLAGGSRPAADAAATDDAGR